MLHQIAEYNERRPRSAINPVDLGIGPKNGVGFLRPRTPLFLQGFARPAQHRYRVVHGCVATAQTLPDGRRQIIDLIGPGRLIGLGLGATNPYSAETLGFTRIEPVSGAMNPSEMEAAYLEEIGRNHALAMLLGRKTAIERVATALIDLAGQFGRPARHKKRSAVTFHLYPTRSDLADWLGLTVETVSRSITRFKKAELIAFQTTDIITLLDPQMLASVASGDHQLMH